LNIGEIRSIRAITEQKAIPFDLPAELEAHEPPEARGLARDGVRLMVTSLAPERIVHAGFRDFPDFLHAGDVLVVNTSATVNAAVQGFRQDGTVVEVHFSTRLPAASGKRPGRWIVELRRPLKAGSEPFLTACAGEALRLPGDARLTLDEPYPAGRPEGAVRLWVATVTTAQPVDRYLERYGFPIRYKHVERAWPLSYYQTVYADEPGSAEMPSAGRPFTQEILDRLAGKGVKIAKLVLHTGVASPEAHEPPPPEYYRLPVETAQAVNAAHQNGGRVIAVGTTVIRALETLTGSDRRTRSGEGWTELVIAPERGIFAADGLLSGFHEPRSSHLLMLAALASPEQLGRFYAEALRQGYLWHEFGDVQLILP
jgi:S-adenosylmethionine:tRNA ribosyltransferase-isomerase